jgi:hypothetical protein
MTQNYKNHMRLFPLHHFVATPLTVGLFIWSLTGLGNLTADNKGEVVFRILVSLALVLIAFIARIYGIKNQDRLIRLEMRQRYFELTGKSFKTLENQLRLGQIIALRFAGDDELLSLIDRAIAEKLKSKDIKLAVKNWQADFHRV